MAKRKDRCATTSQYRKKMMEIFDSDSLAKPHFSHRDGDDDDEDGSAGSRVTIAIVSELGIISLLISVNRMNDIHDAVCLSPWTL